MLMELWERHRRVWIVILAVLFLAFSFYFYYKASDREQELPLQEALYPTEMDQPTNVIGPESLVASAKPSSAQTSYASGSAPPAPTAASSLATAFSSAEPSAPAAKEPIMYVDVKGQVKQPGIYPFRDNERIADAIDKAGGFLPTADPMQVNLAQHLADGMYIIVPAKGNQSTVTAMPVIATAGGSTGTGTTGTTGNIGGSPTAGSTASNSGRPSLVNLNTASAEQLATLPGIGKARAEAILAYREQHGKFTKVEQLTNISGIGSKMFEKLKGKISVD